LPLSSRTQMAKSLLSPDLSRRAQCRPECLSPRPWRLRCRNAPTLARLSKHGRCCGSRKSTSSQGVRAVGFAINLERLENLDGLNNDRRRSNRSSPVGSCKGTTNQDSIYPVLWKNGYDKRAGVILGSDKFLKAAGWSKIDRPALTSTSSTIARTVHEDEFAHGPAHEWHRPFLRRQAFVFAALCSKGTNIPVARAGKNPPKSMGGWAGARGCCLAAPAPRVAPPEWGEKRPRRARISWTPATRTLSPVYSERGGDVSQHG
jgi:hypothetical protein